MAEQTKIKLIKDFMDKQAFIANTAPKRRCWKKCGICNKPWNEIETEKIHLVQETGRTTYFIDDTCLEKIQIK